MLEVSHASLTQHHNGYIYASAHVHDVDGRVKLDHTHDDPVDIDAGFEVAPGDDSDIQVVNEHGWQSGGMAFSDGGFAWTALDIAQRIEQEIEAKRNPSQFLYFGSDIPKKGIACYFVRRKHVLKSHDESGKKIRSGGFHRVGARVHASGSRTDILLRKKRA